MAPTIHARDDTRTPLTSRRLLFVDSGAALGGSEQLLLTLLDGFKRRGFQIDFCHRDEGLLLPAFQARAHHTWRVPQLTTLAVRHPLRALGAIRALQRIVKTTRAEAIVTASPPDFSLLGTLRRLGAPPILAHLGWLFSQRSPLYRKSLEWVDAGVAPAPRIASDWRSLGWPESRLHEVPNGIDLERFSPSSDRAGLRASLGFSPDTRQVVFCGRVVPEKGVFTLLGAWAMARPPQSRLSLCGPITTDMRTRLETLASELRLPADSWCLTGPQAQPERWLAAADLVVVPSESDEAFGLGAVEAMACGTPVVLSDSGALPSLLPPDAKADVVFPAGDATALAARLDHWLSVTPAERATRGAVLCAHARARFSADLMVDRYAAILETILPHARA